MNARERVALAIGHRVPDRVPRGELCIDDALVQAFLRCDAVGFVERWEFARRLGLDIICLSPVYPLETTSGGLPAAAEVAWPDLERWVRESDLFVFVMLDGAFGWGARLCGYEGFFRAVARELPEFTDLIRAVERFNLELAQRAVEAGAMGVLIADDIAYRRGPVINPAVLRRYFMPTLARQAAGVADLGKPVFFHSDGNLDELLADIVKAGFHGLQCLEAAAGMDIGQIKRQYGDLLCLWGNLDPEELILPRSRSELRNEVQALIDVASPGGGFIFGTSSGLFKEMRVENLQAVYDSCC
ncbi:uroporphyrinogen decarboxylase [Peptococcaceae bacterium CEB3]|nr:uroporphyrinogen decarboxylase [Peptococcaceae bacterium CEB3]